MFVLGSSPVFFCWCFFCGLPALAGASVSCAGPFVVRLLRRALLRVDRDFWPGCDASFRCLRLPRRLFFTPDVLGLLVECPSQYVARMRAAKSIISASRGWVLFTAAWLVVCLGSFWKLGLLHSQSSRPPAADLPLRPRISSPEALPSVGAGVGCCYQRRGGGLLFSVEEPRFRSFRVLGIHSESGLSGVPRASPPAGCAGVRTTYPTFYTTANRPPQFFRLSALLPPPHPYPRIGGRPGSTIGYFGLPLYSADLFVSSSIFSSTRILFS